ncbi:unnamed protein product [Phaedon cochleariae]|uniref:Ankyrin repeat domain-containing protein 54 n=1 Tax=Phaedon cochleariae TaxID=80249 RepID=A0A9N9X577_PHACE|nr:unnamed protein product [Phaedon cochleariae]
MSNSGDESKDDLKRRNKKQLHINFKAKKNTVIDDFKLKRRLEVLEPLFLEIRLMRAVITHNTEVVENLLKSGVSANSTDSDGRSALHVAVSRGYVDIVELLLSHGADPNKRDIIQNTPLHLAACVHNLTIVSMLINAKADVSCLDLHGRNPFQLASSKLQILQKGWKEGAIEMIKLREELKQVVDLLLSILMRGIEEKMEKMNQSDIGDLQLMKLSLNSDRPEDLDNQMSRLLDGIEKFKIV